MIILTIRTDKPEAEIGLYDDQTQLAYDVWTAHRALAETLHSKIAALLAGHDKQLTHLEGIVCYQGPGSFTGLRIGLAVGNAYSYGLDIPIVAEGGEGQWLETGIARLLDGERDELALPEYGSEAHITLPKR